MRCELLSTAGCSDNVIDLRMCFLSIGNLRTAALVGFSPGVLISLIFVPRSAPTDPVGINSQSSQCPFTPLMLISDPTVESYCVPNFDSPSVFARILDKKKVSQRVIMHHDVAFTTDTH